MQRKVKRQRVIAIVGPTASGKTSLGIELAKKFSGEIISADSRQLYRGMDILAGVPTRKEMMGIPHHLLRIADPRWQFSAGRFKKIGEKTIRDISTRGRIPIVVGGTGFYADALLSGVTLPDVPPNPKLRAALAKKTAVQLFSQLRRLDPRRARDIDPNNKVRLIRAIEIAKALGSIPPLSSPQHSDILENVGMSYDVLWIGLSPSPEKHRAAIRRRIAARLKRGMLREAALLFRTVSKKRIEALGAEFELIAAHLKEELTPAQLIERLEAWELSYAKRQMRWLRRNKNIHWVANAPEAMHRIKAFIDNA